MTIYKSIKSILEYKAVLLFTVVIFFISPSFSSAADRYWVGGGSSNNWDATGNTNWGSASNTQDNASVPTASDNIFFDSNSPPGIIIDTNMSAASMDLSAFTGMLDLSTTGAGLTINGALIVGETVSFVSGTAATVTLSDVNASYTEVNITQANTTWSAGATLNIQSDLDQILPAGESYGNLQYHLHHGLYGQRHMDY
jgi:hypothetical protein